MAQQKQYVGYSGTSDVGQYLRQTRDDCIRLLQPNTRLGYTQNVTACIFDKFTEFDKSLYSSRQYILTLWPAFIGAIVALAPDPSSMVYDNIWWSALFCVTSGGLPGLDNGASPPHHVETHSNLDGRTMCETWTYDVSRPKALSKAQTMAPNSRGRGHIAMEWIAFTLGLALWMAFNLYFAFTLQSAAVIFNFWARLSQGAVWYYISASPAIIGVIFELLRDRVELYEPIGNSSTVEEATLKSQTSAATATHTARQTSDQRHYRRVQVASVFSLWLRILGHQWYRRSYRILVQDYIAHRCWWFFMIGRGLVGIARITIFALGSVTMGNILLMPVPDDLYLFVLLLFTTAIPRQLWPAFWMNGNRGADLVVFVHDLRMPAPQM